MANTSSAKKAIRTQARKAKVNTAHRREFREARKDVKKTIATGDAKAISEAMSTFTKAVDKAAKTGAIHKNTASRYKSRLANQLGA